MVASVPLVPTFVRARAAKGYERRNRNTSAAILKFESYRRHSGARQRREPGIHKPRLWLWIPGPALTRRPGMTTVGCDRFPRIDGLARISHTTKCIEAPNQGKWLCGNSLSRTQGAPRSRQSGPDV